MTDSFADSLRYYINNNARNRLIDIAETKEALQSTVKMMKEIQTMQDKVFKPNSIEISKWTRFRLIFAKKYLGTDTEGDVTNIVEMRNLKGKIYVTHTWCYYKDKLIREVKL